jgi:hypothetical protein
MLLNQDLLATSLDSGHPRDAVSEYQYYEFVAVEGPISDEGLHYAQTCSSRAEVSRFRWQNVYHFGSFHGKVETLLNHYDAHFYTANWGTTRLGLAFPAGSLALDAIQPYLRGGEQYEDTLSIQEMENRFIVWWERNEEGGWGSTEGEGALDDLIGIREELLRGDYRALFLAWLADFEPDEWLDPQDGAVVLPPIPEGLSRLSQAQTALIEHFPVDDDALTVAAGLSETSAPDRIPIATVVERLPVPEMRALLARVAEGDGARVMSELNRLTNPAPAIRDVPTLSCTDFAAQVVKVREKRRKSEAKAAAAKRKQEEEARRQRLASVMQQADAIWTGLDPLMDQKVAGAYDQVATQLKELRDAHEQAGEGARFRQKLTAFRERYARRTAILRRLAEL